MNRLFFTLLAVFLAAGCQTREVIPLDRATVFYDRATFPKRKERGTDPNYPR